MAQRDVLKLPTAPPAAHGAQEERDGSDLCLACGICCKGAMHVAVDVRAEDAPTASRLGLTLTPLGDGFTFPLPCPLHQDDRCSVYLERPPTCEGYKCALLSKYEAGAVSLDDGLAIVREARALMNGQTWTTVRGDLVQAWDVEQGGVRGEGAAREANIDAALRAVAVDRLLTRHFRRKK